MRKRKWQREEGNKRRRKRKGERGGGMKEGRRKKALGRRERGRKREN